MMMVSSQFGCCTMSTDRAYFAGPDAAKTTVMLRVPPAILEQSPAAGNDGGGAAAPMKSFWERMNAAPETGTGVAALVLRLSFLSSELRCKKDDD